MSLTYNQYLILKLKKDENVIESFINPVENKLDPISFSLPAITIRGHYTVDLIEDIDTPCDDLDYSEYNWKIKPIPIDNELINQNLISDKIRFSYDSNHLNRITHFDFLDSETQ